MTDGGTTRLQLLGDFCSAFERETGGAKEMEGTREEVRPEEGNREAKAGKQGEETHT